MYELLFTYVYHYIVYNDIIVWNKANDFFNGWKTIIENSFESLSRLKKQKACGSSLFKWIVINQLT